MDRAAEPMACGRCHEEVTPTPPRRSFWAMIVAFWVFSLLLGIGTVLTSWGLVFVLAWVALACAMGLMARRARTWRCPVCSAAMPPPSPQRAPEQTGVHARASLKAKHA